ncbi:MAG: DUF3159 domain-containing protein [Kineosporiaceae bacterium]|nr:DUF3159 domain-containing protein [Kineosporiaceae bacterium]
MPGTDPGHEPVPGPVTGPATGPVTGPVTDPAGSSSEASGRLPASSLAAAVGEQFSLEKSIGGVRGLLEAVVPITIFSLVYGITHDIRTSCVAALVPSVAFAIWRLIRRESLTQAVSGVLGLGLGAFLALRTGRSENFFLPSIIKNAAYGAGYAVSILLRWPVIGLLLGFALGELTHWRRVPARLRVYQQATWVWVGMFGLRLLVQVPLYLLGMTATLGLVSVPLGIPLFALAAYLTWVIIRRVPVAHATPATVEPTGGRADRTPAEG